MRRIGDRLGDGGCDVTEDTGKARKLNGHGGNEPAPANAAEARREGWKPVLVIVAFLCFAGAVWGVAKDSSLDWPEMLAGSLGVVAALLLVGSGRR